MQALTIKQPWATLIMRAGKDIENRNWPASFRGEVAIHASKGFDGAEVAAACRFLDSWVPRFSEGRFRSEAATYPTGCIIGVARIVDCVTASDSPWFVGPFGLVIRDTIELVDPLPLRGMLGFWQVPEVTQRLLRAQLERQKSRGRFMEDPARPCAVSVTLDEMAGIREQRKRKGK